MHRQNPDLVPFLLSFFNPCLNSGVPYPIRAVYGPFICTDPVLKHPTGLTTVLNQDLHDEFIKAGQEQEPAPQTGPSRVKTGDPELQSLTGENVKVPTAPRCDRAS